MEASAAATASAALTSTALGAHDLATTVAASAVHDVTTVEVIAAWCMSSRDRSREITGAGMVRWSITVDGTKTEFVFLLLLIMN